MFRQIFRKSVFWIHLAGGCVAGMVVLIVAITGILMSFRTQVIQFADRDFRSRLGAFCPYGRSGRHCGPVTRSSIGRRRSNA